MTQSIENSRIAMNWRGQSERYRLEGSLCPQCGPSFPGRKVCLHCGKTVAQYQEQQRAVALLGIAELQTENHEDVHVQPADTSVA